MREPSSELCYVLLPAQDYTVGIVKFGESGYYKTNYPEGYTQETVDTMNERLGLTKLEAEAMKITSMNQGLSGEAWAQHYEMVLESLEKHQAEKETKDTMHKNEQKAKPANEKAEKPKHKDYDSR